MTQEPYPTEGASGLVEPEPSGRRVAGTVVGLVLLALATGVLSFFGLLLVFLSDGCGTGSECDDGLLTAGWLIAMAGVWAPAIAGLVWALVRLHARRSAWWVPLVALAGVLVVFVVGVALAIAGGPST